MLDTPEDLLFGRAEEMIAYLDRQIAKAMEPPTWVVGASQSKEPATGRQAQEWRHQQFLATQLLRETRNHLINSLAFSRALKDPRYLTLTPPPTTTRPSRSPLPESAPTAIIGGY